MIYDGIFSMSWAQPHCGLKAVAGLVVLFVPSLQPLGRQERSIYVFVYRGWDRDVRVPT